MRWQIAVAPHPGHKDSLGHQVLQRLRAQGFTPPHEIATAKLYAVEGPTDRAQVERLRDLLFCDSVIEVADIRGPGEVSPEDAQILSVFRKPGVMDPVEAGILRAAGRLQVPLTSASTGTRYTIRGATSDEMKLAAALLANPAIEVVVFGTDRFPDRVSVRSSSLGRREIPLRNRPDAELLRISQEGGLSLTLLEMRAIEAHFRSLDREPTEIELETLAQTWSEHCKHKTLAGAVHYVGDAIDGVGEDFVTSNLLKDTIKAATETLDREFCLSVFHDNAGVIDFTDDQALCIKVETHNHPSAIEPYGGAGTGIGGEIRDILGTGLGARPVANTNVFCVAPLDMVDVPAGAQPPLRILRGVVSGVRDYGNQMGIPTVNGALVFDERYVGNPLVYCGTVGIIPKNKIHKIVRAGEFIVALGGRTGRDGIHGATFSSAELHEGSEVIDSGAVQIGNAITEKKTMDVLLAARDAGLYTAVTDCGAGGFSSAVGEMGETCGARVHLDRAPLKYSGLSPTEIWISEAQERMVVSVKPEHVEQILALCAAEDVEAFVLGEFTGTGRLELFYGEECVGDLSMEFLHGGLPRITRQAPFRRAVLGEGNGPPVEVAAEADLLSLLRHPNVASKEWIIRQYDHEVQAGSVVKPLVGTRAHGPSDGAVVAPILGSTVGFAMGLGINPHLGDEDPYVMALAVIDEALRNVVCLGGDPDHTAILDNFCWGNAQKPDRLGGLVRAAYGCRDAAVAFGTPFISGKDSLNNEFKVGDRTITIPPTLLITALSRVPDVREAVTMDFKEPDNILVLVGLCVPQMGGSLYRRIKNAPALELPKLDAAVARKTYRAVHQSMRKGLVRACHDPSDGGLAVALAEMVLASEIGAHVDLENLSRNHSTMSLEALLFGEGMSRLLLEIRKSDLAALESECSGVPFAILGSTTKEPILRIMRGATQLVSLSAEALEAAWRPGLANHLDPSRE